jgi:ribosomal protein S18 acetylase RimI-like enzyme
VEHARIASAGDIARVVDLARELRSELEAYRGGPLWVLRDAGPEPLEQVFAAAIEDAERTLVVGTLDEVVVGYGLLDLERLRDGSPLGRVDELYVEPDARGVGVGEAMSALIVGRARAVGCRGIDVVALPGHRATKNFFEEQGFTARALVMHLELDSAR